MFGIKRVSGGSDAADRRDAMNQILRREYQEGGESIDGAGEPPKGWMENPENHYPGCDCELCATTLGKVEEQRFFESPDPDCAKCNDTGIVGLVTACIECDAFAKVPSKRHVRAAWEHDRARMRITRRCSACAGVGKLPNGARTDFVICDVCDGRKVA